MRTARRLLVGMIVLCAVGTTTGCVGYACAGAASELPHVELDLMYWFQANPGSSVTACFDTVCQTADGPGILHLYATTDDVTHPERAYELRIETTVAGRGSTTVSQSVNLIESPQEAPCGPGPQWRLPVVLTPDGTVIVSPPPGEWLTS